MAEKNFIFGTKSENLYQLKEKLDYSKIPKFIYFNIREWKNNKDTIIFNIINKFIKNKIVVRSSGKDEDGNKYSLAGKFLSLLNVKTTKNNIINAVKNSTIPICR